MQSFIEENIIFKYTTKQNLNPTFTFAELSLDPYLFWQIGNVMVCFDGGEAMF